MVRYEVILKNLKKERLDSTMEVYEQELVRINVKYTKEVDPNTGYVIYRSDDYGLVGCSPNHILSECIECNRLS